jgi:hypothetical protein
LLLGSTVLSDDKLLDQAAELLAEVRLKCLSLGLSPTELAELLFDEAILGLMAERRSERDTASFCQRLAKKRVREWYAMKRRSPE